MYEKNPECVKYYINIEAKTQSRLYLNLVGYI